MNYNGDEIIENHKYIREPKGLKLFIVLFPLCNLIQMNMGTKIIVICENFNNMNKNVINFRMSSLVGPIYPLADIFGHVHIGISYLNISYISNGKCWFKYSQMLAKILAKNIGKCWLN